jgi:hypothetical protein
MSTTRSFTRAITLLKSDVRKRVRSIDIRVDGICDDIEETKRQLHSATTDSIRQLDTIRTDIGELKAKVLNKKPKPWWKRHWELLTFVIGVIVTVIATLYNVRATIGIEARKLEIEELQKYEGRISQLRHLQRTTDHNLGLLKQYSPAFNLEVVKSRLLNKSSYGKVRSCLMQPLDTQPWESMVANGHALENRPHLDSLLTKFYSSILHLKGAIEEHVILWDRAVQAVENHTDVYVIQISKIGYVLIEEQKHLRPVLDSLWKQGQFLPDSLGAAITSDSLWASQLRRNI